MSLMLAWLRNEEKFGGLAKFRHNRIILVAICNKTDRLEESLQIRTGKRQLLLGRSNVDSDRVFNHSA